ncbi:MAG: autotransporter outer membrane beta-barrel domain-containing protein [Pseudomonadota bacterium]
MVTQRIMLSCAAAALIAGSAGALGQDVEITDDLTTPQSTPSTGSFTIVDGGSITVSNADAVTADTDSDVTMNGGIAVEGDDANLAGIRVVGDRTLSVIVNGQITLDSSLEVGDDEVPVDFPNNRFGVVLDTGGSITGNVLIDSGAEIRVEGDSGGGVVLQCDLDGDFNHFGVIVHDGDQSQGIRLENVSGDVTIAENSSVNVTGVETDAVLVTGNVDGSFIYGGSATTTAYTDLARDIELDDNEGVDPEDQNNDFQATLVSGHGISLLGNVAGGVLIDGPIDLETSLDTDSEATPGQGSNASVTVFGGGNALRIGNESTVSTIGTVASEDGLASDYGSWSIINRGVLSATGIYDGIATEVVRIQNITADAGFRNSGEIAGSSIDADSVGLRITGTTTLPEVLVEQDIRATVDGTGNATAFLIDEDVTLPTIRAETTLATISASADGGDAVAVRDLSGTVTTFHNGGSIIRAIQPDEDEDEENPATTIALDFSVNTSGVAITNTVSQSFDEEDNERSLVGFIVGDVITGSGDDTFLSDAGAVSGDITLGAGNDIIRFTEESIYNGDASVGAGNDTIEFSAFTGEGTLTFGSGDDTFRLMDEADWTGDARFGAGTDVFELSGGSAWTGGILNTDDLTVSVDSSTFTLTNSQQATLTDLSVSNEGRLEFELPATGSDVARIQSSGTVSIDSTSSIGILSVEGFSGTIENRLITAGTLNVDIDALDIDGDINSSFLVEEVLALDDNNPNSLVLRRRRRNADEVGLFAEEAPSFDPALSAIEGDQELSDAIYGATTEEEFLGLYRQLTPEPLDMAITAVRAQNTAMNSIIRHRTRLEGEDIRLGNRHAWIKQELFFINRSEGRGSEGFDGYGIMLALGADRKMFGLDTLGIAGSLSSTQLEEKLGDDFPVTRVTTGLDVYATKAMGRFVLDGRFGYGWASSDSERNISFDLERRDFDASWDGTQITGHGKVQYLWNTGRFDVTPTVSIDYLSIEEDGYTEDNLDDSAAITAEDRDAESLRLNSGLSLGWTRERRQRNEFSGFNTAGPTLAETRFSISAGLSQELQDDVLSGTYRFGDGDAFTLEMEQEETAYFLGGDLSYRNGFMRFSTGFNGSFGEETTIGSAYISVGIDW